MSEALRLERAQQIARRAAEAIVSEFSPLLGTPGDEGDDCTDVVTRLITNVMLTEDRPTVIDAAEVFDSEGTLSLQINGYDVLYLSKCSRDPEDPNYPDLTDEQHQQVIDTICTALKV